MGRLNQVTETGISANTYYSYDALDDLTAVTPPSGFTGRSFVNSSLKRLISATNPETGTITYAYDPNGNLLTKTAGGATTTYAYDQLDELLSKTYSDSTPSASYTYSKGWRSAASSGSTAYTYLFDGLGRANTATQTTNGTPYQFTYVYNLVDEITKMTMPSGTVIMNSYDPMGRPNSVSGQAISASSATTYGSGIIRTPAGAIQQMTLGNGLTEQTCFNNMLQPFVIRQRRNTATSCQTGTASDSYDVGYFAFTFPTGNNGNIAGQTIQYAASGSYSPMAFQQTYGYDGVNRLSNVTETGSGPTWSQSFGYDAVGNRWLSGGAQIDPTTPTSDVFNSNNQINATTYDAKGNQQTNGGYSFTYDAENRLITTNMFGTTYGYDADGRRVTKTSSGLITTYVYDVTDQLSAQYGGPASCPLTCYLMTDHLGSTRMQTDSSGNQLTLYDYAPFGEELAGLDGRDARWGGFGSGIHFTGKEQEGYEGEYMHYFGARYFSAGLGRFTSPDSPLADQDVSDPQSWNLYGYVRNKSLSNTDPDGTTTCDENGDHCHDTVVVEGGSSSNAFNLWALTRQFASEVAQAAANAASGAMQSVNDFRHNSNCTGTLVAAGASIGATVLGAKSAEAGFALGGIGGLETGPGAIATAAGGAALAGAAGTAVGYWAGGGLGGVAGGLICASGMGGGGQPSANQPGSNKFWRSLKAFRGKTRTNGLSGRARQFFEWDYTHDDVEVYDSRGRHLGSADPDTGAMTKPAVPGRRIEI